MSPRHRTTLLPVVVGALLVATLPFGLSGALPWRDVPTVGDAADPLQQAAILQWTLRRLPLSTADWNAPWLWPAPHALATMDPLVMQALLVTWLPGARGNAALAYNAALALTLALSFLAVRLLARRLGLGRGAAWLAGVAYAVGPYAASHAMHLNQLPQPWLPLALLGLLRMGNGRTSGALLLAGALLAQLASGVYLMAATCAAVAIVAIVMAPKLSRRTWMALAGAMLVVAVALWAYSRPYAAAAAELPGFVRTPQQVGPFAARPFDLLHPPASHLLPWPRALDARPSLYPGWLWVLLAACGTLALWREHARGTVERWWMVGLFAASFVGLVLAFGRTMPLPILGEVSMPFAWLQDAVWPLRAIRAPSRFFVVASLALALCGAGGAAWCWRRFRTSPLRALAVAGLLLALLELAPGRTARLRVQPDVEERAVLVALAAQPRPSPWVTFPQPCSEAEERALDARAMLWAVLADQPVAGGASGFVPNEVAALRSACCAGADARCLAHLERAGVRLVLSRRGLVPPDVSPRRVAGAGEWELLGLLPE